LPLDSPLTLDDSIRIEGKVAVVDAMGGSTFMFGLFNEHSRGWRTPNSLFIRFDGSEGAYRTFFEYGTKNFRTGGGHTFEGPMYQTTSTLPDPADGSSRDFVLEYNPEAADGDGEIVLTLDGETYSAPLAEGHRADGAVFDR